MTSAERRSVGALAAIYASRMLGMFLMLPVLALYAHTLPDYSPELLGLAMGAYGLTQAVLQIPFGRWSDRLGRKPMITLGLLFYALGSVPRHPCRQRRHPGHRPRHPGGRCGVGFRHRADGRPDPRRSPHPRHGRDRHQHRAVVRAGADHRAGARSRRRRPWHFRGHAGHGAAGAGPAARRRAGRAGRARAGRRAAGCRACSRS